MLQQLRSHLTGLRPHLRNRLRTRFWVGFCLGLVLLNLAIAAPAYAITQMSVSNIRYEECPEEIAGGMVASGSSQPATCYLILGTVNNPTGKTVYDADVFGRVYDQSHNSVMQNRTRLGGIPEVPSGKSDFSIRISVPSSQKPPLQLEQFKAAGFSSAVRLAPIESSDLDDDALDNEDYAF